MGNKSSLTLSVVNFDLKMLGWVEVKVLQDTQFLKCQRVFLFFSHILTFIQEQWEINRDLVAGSTKVNGKGNWNLAQWCWDKFMGGCVHILLTHITHLKTQII